MWECLCKAGSLKGYCNFKIMWLSCYAQNYVPGSLCLKTKLSFLFSRPLHKTLYIFLWNFFRQNATIAPEKPHLLPLHSMFQEQISATVLRQSKPWSKSSLFTVTQVIKSKPLLRGASMSQSYVGHINQKSHRDYAFHRGNSGLGSYLGHRRYLDYITTQ